MLHRLAIGVTLAALVAAGAHAAEKEGHVENFAFSWEGPFGTFDQNQLQRGLQVFTEVCSACHGMTHVPIRSLSDAGGPMLPEDQVRAYATQWDITDPETGEDRPRVPTDHFPVSGLANAPDLSVMAKARAGFHGPWGTGISPLVNGMGGPEYIASLLTGYTGVEKEEAGVVLYENKTMAGGWIAMSPPLSDDLVAFADGSPATVEAMAKDVTAFLTWAAEPKMMARKQAGFTAVVFLGVLAALLYLTNKRLWVTAKRRHEV